MIEFIAFIFFKTVALLFVAVVLGIPLFVAYVITFAPSDPNEGATLFRKSLIARQIYRVLAGAFCAMAYITFASWAWPFGHPRDTMMSQHITGAAWNLVIESFDERNARLSAAVTPTRTELSTEIRRFELVDWNPPKHFYVTLKDVKTGVLHENVYVSKHCAAASQLKHGDQLNLQVRYYTLSNRPDERLSEFSNLYTAFCGANLIVAQ